MTTRRKWTAIALCLLAAGCNRAAPVTQSSNADTPNMEVETQPETEPQPAIVGDASPAAPETPPNATAETPPGVVQESPAVAAPEGPSVAATETPSVAASDTAPIEDDVSPGLAVGTKAPEFVLKNQANEDVTLAQLLSEHNVALVFYRSADW